MACAPLRESEAVWAQARFQCPSPTESPRIHPWLERQVALKLIAPERAQHAGFRERFLRESRLAASLEHAHVIPIYEAGEAGGVLYLAMRYVEGTDLGALLAGRRAYQGRHAPREGLPSRRARRGSAGPAGENATVLWAVVANRGALGDNRGALSVQRLEAGRYVVTFEQNMDECIALATIGLGTGPGTLARSDTVISATNRGQANDAAVTVTTWDAGDAARKDSSFMLAMFC